LRTRLLPLFAVLAAGCGSDSPARDTEPATRPATLGAVFDAAKTGRVAGRVVWAGPIPDPPPFLFAQPRPDGAGLIYQSAENPNRPRVDAKSRAVAGAVVFLRGIDTAASRPWDLPPVSVEMGAGKITVVQGDRRERVGFVRRGESFSAKSVEPVFHILRGRGDAYFSLTLPAPDRPVSRALPGAGRVELSSGSGLYWARADLFVAEHPYVTVTDADGRFSLEQVPAGRVEVVAWVPGWQVARQDRNPDTTAVSEMTYTPPVERVAPIAVNPGEGREVNFSMP
jgi:hypothetical protein